MYNVSITENNKMTKLTFAQLAEKALHLREHDEVGDSYPTYDINDNVVVLVEHEFEWYRIVEIYAKPKEGELRDQGPCYELHTEHTAHGWVNEHPHCKQKPIKIPCDENGLSNEFSVRIFREDTI